MPNLKFVFSFRQYFLYQNELGSLVYKFIYGQLLYLAVLGLLIALYISFIIFFVINVYSDFKLIIDEKVDILG